MNFVYAWLFAFWCQVYRRFYILLTLLEHWPEGVIWSKVRGHANLKTCFYFVVVLHCRVTRSPYYLIIQWKEWKILCDDKSLQPLNKNSRPSMPITKARMFAWRRFWIKCVPSRRTPSMLKSYFWEWHENIRKSLNSQKPLLRLLFLASQCERVRHEKNVPALRHFAVSSTISVTSIT